MSTGFITRLAGGVGIRIRQQPAATVAAKQEFDGIQDIADRLERIHDYLSGGVASLDDDPPAEPATQPETGRPTPARPAAVFGDFDLTSRSAA